MTKIDPSVQAQVDAQLMEQGAFTAIELLINAGRLLYSDYEMWRRGEIDSLDGVLMGSAEKIQAKLEAAVAYARSIGLVEQTQEFHAWRTDAQSDTGKSLRVSSSAALNRLIAGKYAPAQSAPQMDLFFNNPVAALTNGVVRALAGRDADEAQRQLDLLYALSPNHADLVAFDKLLIALGHLNRTIDEPQQELEFLLEITPTAKRLLGSQARDLLTPLWGQLAAALEGRVFSSRNPTLHRSFALTQAQNWPGVSECVLHEPQWWMHAPLCLHLAQSAFYRQRRIEALSAWCHLCFRHPDTATRMLDKRQQPDAGVIALWERFLDVDEEVDAPDAALTASDFPAWLLLNAPGLTLQLPCDLPTGDTPGEQAYCCVHRLLTARRASQREEELALRKQLQAIHPVLFRLAKATV